MKLYTCTTSYQKTYKCNIRNSFCHLLSLAFFYWCLQYKCPTVNSHHIWVPFTALSLFHSGNILMEPFTVVVTDSSHIPQEIFQVGLQEMGFQQHVAPQGTAWAKWLLHNFNVVFFSFISQKVAVYVFRHVPGSPLSSTQFNLAVRVLKNMLYLRTAKNATDVVAVYRIIIHRKVLCNVQHVSVYDYLQGVTISSLKSQLFKHSCMYTRCGGVTPQT